MQGPPTQLMAYLPSVSLRATEQTEPVRRVLLASCLWLDMSGFTPLTERLSAEGPVGIERLSETLNRLYAAVASAARATSGDVMFFAGDGALCLWEATDAPGVGAAAWLAASAAERLLDDLARTTVDGFRFELRQVVVAGELTLDTVGGDAGAWQDVVTGAPLRALSRLGRACRPGQVLLSERVALALGKRAQVAKLEPDTYLLQHLQADEEAAAAVRPSTPTPIPVLVASASKVPGFLSKQLSETSLPPSELRRVSVAFMTWKTPDSAGMDELQALSLCLQQAARRFGGWLCQLVQDDKGLTGLVVFGLPGHAQGEDAVRAVRYATEVSEQLAAQGLTASFGVATGPTFCGVCGGQERLQYCVLGNAVNRAARLADQRLDGPLVDESTFLAAHWRLDFMHQGSLRLKGVSSVVEAYRPGTAREASFAPSALVAFEAERAELRAWLFEFRTGAANRPLVVRGDLGAGKTSFLGQIPAECAEIGAELLFGACDQFEQHTGYFALRPIMRRLLGDASQPQDVEWLKAALAELGQEEQLSLLNPLLLADFPAAPLVRQMAPETRAENRKQLAVGLLKERLEGRRIVVVIDDAHWLDASSLELVIALGSQLPGLTFVLAERSGELGAQERATDARVLEMKPLDVEAVGQLVAQLTGATNAAPALARLVWESSRGNPLHCTELSRALLASGRVEVADATLRLKPGNDGALEVPGSLEELIQGRFDHLSAPTRDVLRTASVLGVTFDLPLLREVLGERGATDEVDAALKEALERGIVRSRGTYQFEHASVQAVVYGLLLPSEQRQLHERTARALQITQRASLDAVAARLAHHWLRAGNAERAAHFSALAADQALEGYANPDAEHLFRQAIEQDTAFRGRLQVSLERARWSMLMGQALYSQSRHAEARRAYEGALHWTGMAMPGGLWALPFTIARLLLFVLLTSIGRKPKLLVDEPARSRRILSIRIINTALPLDAWEGRLFAAANKAFVAFRLSASVGDTPEAAETVAGLGYLLSSTPARGLSEAQILRGLAAADKTGDLQARTSTRVLLGMHYTASGLTPRAGEPLRIAQGLAERLGSGLWRHRAWFGLGEALLSSGQLAEASDAFDKAAEIAALAEPPVEGFANCMRALTISRLGRLDEALAIALGPRGLSLVAGNCLVLQRFTSLGITAELSLAAGRRQQALGLAQEALALSATRPDVNVFFAALFGHTGCSLVYLAMVEAEPELTKPCRAALGRLGAFSRMYPAAAPSAALLTGAHARARGQHEKARRAWQRAAALAQAHQQPFEQVVALEWLAAQQAASTELGQARARAKTLGIVLEPAAWWQLGRGAV
jgi:class 3 adenylate cyclase/tetratricopeptide (TPR) repeat protein